MATEEQRQRLIEAALECAAAFGIRKTSLSDVAARAGVSRATAYRVFGSKQGLIDQVTAAEVGRQIAQTERAIAELPADAPLEDLIALSADCTLSFMRGHAVLQKMLAEEPEQLIDVLYERPGHALAAHRVMLAHLAPRIAAHPEAHRLRISPEDAADWLVRIVHSFVVAPDSAVSDGRTIARLSLYGLFGE